MTKNSVVKIQNLVVNHESRPVKSNVKKIFAHLSDTGFVSENGFGLTSVSL